MQYKYVSAPGGSNSTIEGQGPGSVVELDDYTADRLREQGFGLERAEGQQGEETIVTTKETIDSIVEDSPSLLGKLLGHGDEAGGGE